MDNNPLNGAVTIEEYQPITGCESDDSRSSISRSDDNEPIPSIIYTSDDSADAIISRSTYIDSDEPSYIAQNVCQEMEDDTSRQLLLHSSCPSRQTSPQPNDFITKPLSSLNFNDECNVNEEGHLVNKNKTQLFSDISNLQVHSDKNFCLIPSSCSTSSELNPEVDHLLPTYHPLDGYTDDYSGLSFNNLNTDPVKAKVMQDQLDKLVGDKEINMKQGTSPRFFVGDIHIDSKYKDMWYVSWNWKKIRSVCTFIQVSILIALLCIGISLLVRMPKGSDCNPHQEWWQGTVVYHVFVPSFKDSNGDGIGDIDGIIEKLDYIQHTIGAKVLRLSCVFGSDHLIHPISRNYSHLSANFGSQNDFHLLSVLLHQRGMHLILDFPLTNAHPNMYHIKPKDFDDMEEEMKMMESYKSRPIFLKSEIVDLEEIPDILKHWLSLGVDGFSFVDLHLLTYEKELANHIHRWRNTLDQYAALAAPVLMVPSMFLNNLEKKGSMDVHHLVSLIDLIEIDLDFEQPVAEIVKKIEEGSKWDKHPSFPWINWEMGAVGKERISRRTNETTYGYNLFMLSLPGTVSLYYGDELSLKGSSNNNELSWAALMQWNDKENCGFSETNPWIEYNEIEMDNNVINQNSTIHNLQKMVQMRLEKVALYVNGILSENSGKMEKKSNLKIKYKEDNLLVIERSYPRRRHFAIAANFGEEWVEKDLSHMYYGGDIAAATMTVDEYFKFENTSLPSKGVFVCVLDM